MSKSVVIRRGQQSSSGESSEIWIRLQAFLALKSPGTRVTYTGILLEWCDFLGALPGTQEGAEKLATAQDLHAAAYRAWLERRPGEAPRAKKTAAFDITPAVERRKASKKTGLEHTLSNATIAKKFAALRRLYRVLISSGLAGPINPFDSDRTPPPPHRSGRKRPTEMIDIAKVSEILSLPDCSTEKGRRDKAILSVFFGGGLRRSEVINLCLCDVKKTARGTTYLHLRATKARRDAEQALPPWAAEAVWQVVHDRRNQKAETGDPLFVGYTGKGGVTPSRKALSPVGLYELFRSYCARAGIGAHVSPHSARATAITKLLADGIPHREVQQFSRHASVQMVEEYDKRRLQVDTNPAKDLDY